MANLRDTKTTQADRYWFTLRGAQQLDLAIRFEEAARALGLHLLVLKGAAIAEELYGGFAHRPMFDIDFLLVETHRFAEAAEMARGMGLVETDASDHALAFKENASGAVIELHISLTSCPGLFTLDPAELWMRRKLLAPSGLSRLSDEDAILHCALHTAFQHGFAANAYHYADFVRAVQKWRPLEASLESRAREWGALKALGAMAAASFRRPEEDLDPASPLAALQRHCPKPLHRWIRSEVDFPPPMGFRTLAFVRLQLTPSIRRYLLRAMLPEALPGRTFPRPRFHERLASLVASTLRPKTPAAPLR